MISWLLPLLFNALFSNGAPHYIVEVENKADNSVGTGFFIDKNHVLTAQHVTDGFQTLDNLRIQCFDEKHTVLKVIKLVSIKSKDISVMETDGSCPEQVILKIAKSSEPVGNDVYSIGCPGTLPCGTLSKGIVSGYMIDSDTKNFILYSDVKVWFGSSGGPLINTKGEVVGLLSQIHSESEIFPQKKGNPEILSQNFALYVPVKVLSAFVEDALNIMKEQ